jgi:amino acid transporter
MVRPDLAGGVGAAMILALYAYLGYYNVCHVGDEVRDPGRTIPRSVLLSTALVVVLFAGLHLAMLGTVSWRDVPPDEKGLDGYSLAAEMMRRCYRGAWAVWLVTLLLVWSCLGSFFAGLLGYSRVPYGAARGGHFFRLFAAVHPRLRVPHRSLLLVGGCALAWAFLDFSTVVNALIVTRVLEQFVAQVVGVGVLRRLRPDLARPFRVWLYPVPAALALLGWGYVYWSAERLYVVVGLATLGAGVVAFLAWARLVRGWPFDGPRPPDKDGPEGGVTPPSPAAGEATWRPDLPSGR